MPNLNVGFLAVIALCLAFPMGAMAKCSGNATTCWDNTSCYWDSSDGSCNGCPSAHNTSNNTWVGSSKEINPGIFRCYNPSSGMNKDVRLGIIRDFLPDNQNDSISNQILICNNNAKPVNKNVIGQGCECEEGFVETKDQCVKQVRELSIKVNVEEAYANRCKTSCPVQDFSVWVRNWGGSVKFADDNYDDTDKWNSLDDYDAIKQKTTRTLRKFDGLYSATSGGTKYFDGNYSPDIGNLFPASSKDNTFQKLVLYVHWKNNFTIEYKDGHNTDNPQPKSYTCKPGTGNECQSIIQYPGNWNRPKAEEFKEWKCEYTYYLADTSQKVTVTENVAPGADILTSLIAKMDPMDASANVDNNTITCASEYEDCPAGYWCPPNDDTEKRGKQPCPAGATSTERTTEKNGCYLSNKTVFCDYYGCFTIPDLGTGKVFYTGSK